MINSPFYRNNNYSKPRSSSVPPAKKVVSVPVHFISSDEPPTLMTRDSAALKIQRVFRGFIVRKSVKKISSVRNEIVNIEQRIINNNKEFVNSIRDDPKERLRVNETLMSLLLKLDSVRGFDCGVRDFRKSVTKKAIAVQERVDSIECSDVVDVLKGEEEDPGDEIVGKEEEEEEEEEEEGDCVVGSSMEVEKDDDEEDSSRWEKLMICDKNDDNKMLKLMMMQMSERNEMQTRMINSLSRRVEQLEKAFLIHHLTRKKNNNKKTASSSRRRRRRGLDMMMRDNKEDNAFCI